MSFQEQFTLSQEYKCSTDFSYQMNLRTNFKRNILTQDMGDFAELVIDFTEISNDQENEDIQKKPDTASYNASFNIQISNFKVGAVIGRNNSIDEISNGNTTSGLNHSNGLSPGQHNQSDNGIEGINPNIKNESQSQQDLKVTDLDLKTRFKLALVFYNIALLVFISALVALIYWFRKSRLALKKELEQHSELQTQLKDKESEYLQNQKVIEDNEESIRKERQQLQEYYDEKLNLTKQKMRQKFNSECNNSGYFSSSISQDPFQSNKMDLNSTAGSSKSFFGLTSSLSKLAINLNN
eukprot:403363136